MHTEVILAQRFCGPPTSGHGGYVTGILAEALDGACEVTLRRPIPLDTPLRLSAEGTETALSDPEGEIAAGRCIEFHLDLPPLPKLSEIEKAQSPLYDSPFGTCFVCGAARAPDDGMRVFTKRTPIPGLVADKWEVGAHLAESDGSIAPRMVWAVLDCPSAFSFSNPDMVTLLGRMRGEVYATPQVGDQCTVFAWSLGSEGRKHFAASALFDAQGHLMGATTTTWFDVRDRMPAR